MKTILLFITALCSMFSALAQCPMAPNTPAGTLDTCFTPFDRGIRSANTEVCAVLIQPDGKILVGGRLKRFNGIARGRLARVNPDASLDYSFNSDSGFNGDVRTLALQPDGKLIVGGYFTRFDGVIRRKIARLNVDGSLDTSFDPGKSVNGTIYALALQPDGKIIAGGSFDSSNGRPYKRLTRLNKDGSLDSSFNIEAGFDNPSIWRIPSCVYSLDLQPDGRMIVGGRFVTCNGVDRRRIARLWSNGSLDTSFNPGSGFNDDVRSIKLLPQGKMIIGGEFRAFNGTIRNCIAQLNVDGTLDSSFCQGVGFGTSPSSIAGITSLAVQSDGKVLAGGSFNTFNTIACNSIARLNNDGTLDSSFNLGTGFVGGSSDTNVTSVAIQSDGKIVVGGGFDVFDGVPTHRMTRLNADGSWDASFNLGTGFESIDSYIGLTDVQSMILQPDHKILVGGYFSAFNGVGRKCIARLDADGYLDTTFKPGAGFLRERHWSGYNPHDIGGVRTLALQSDGKVLAGGYFTLYNNVFSSYIARLNNDGTLDTSFHIGSGFNDRIDCLILQPDGKVLVAGGFTRFNVEDRSHITRLNADGTLDYQFYPGQGFDGTTSALALQSDGKVLVGGYFTAFGGISRKNIARLNTNGSLDLTFDPGSGFDREVIALALQPDGRLLAGGFFTTYNGSPRICILRLNTDGSLDSSFNPRIRNNLFVTSLAVQPDGRVLVSGVLMDTSGEYHPYLLRFNADGSSDNSFSQGTGFDQQVSCIMYQADNKLLVGGMFASYNGHPESNITRLFAGESAAANRPVAAKSSTLIVMPNPTTGNVRLNGLQANSSTSAHLFNTQGKLVRTWIVNSSSDIDLTDLPTGLYMLRVGPQTARIVKE